MKIFKKAKRGFTLVELVVVIAVIAILAAVSVGAYFGVTESANKSKLEQEGKATYDNIMLVALKGNSNHTLDRDGLTVTDLNVFEDALNEITGLEYDVQAGTTGATTITRHTVYLIDENPQVSGQQNELQPVTYEAFGYYSSDVSGKYGYVSFSDGKVDVRDAQFNIQTNTTLIYFNNAKEWHTTYAYAFKGEDKTETDRNAVWPGISMEHHKGDIVKYELPDGFDKVIFTHGGDNPVEGEGQYTAELANFDEAKPYYTGTAWDVLPTNINNYNTKDLTVYYSNSNYENCFVYAWDVDNHSNSEWPGKPATYDETTGLFSYEFEEDYYKVIFNNGITEGEGQAQTANISLNGFNGNTPFYNGSNWVEKPTIAPQPASDYYVVGNMNDWSSTIDTSMTPVEGKENEYSYHFDNLAINDELKVRYQEDWDQSYGFANLEQEEVYFSTGENGNLKVLVEGPYTIYYNSSTNVVSFDYEGTNPPVQQVSKTKLYFVNTDNWENVYLHYWGSSQSVDTTWPGTELQKEGKYYVYELYNDVDGLIFNNGSTQTSDLTLDPTKPYFVFGEGWKESHEFPAEYTLTINTDPIEAQVIFTAQNGTQNGKSYTAVENTTISYQVICTGYDTKTGEIILTQDEIIDVKLDVVEQIQQYTYTINSINGANIVLSAEGFTPNGNSITVDEGTTVSYSISKDGYTTKTGSKLITNNITETIYLNATVFYLDIGTSGWDSDGARFAINYFGGTSGQHFKSFEHVEGKIYKVDLSGLNFKTIIICRMNGSNTTNDWSNKWNQTNDISIPTKGENCITITGFGGGDYKLSIR